MCGFAGEFVFGVGASASTEPPRAMAARLGRRDRADVAAWMSEDGRCAIGFVSPALASDRRAAVAMVGDLLDPPGCGAEELLALWRREGGEICTRLEGALALAIYDAEGGKLLLARDRLGHKSLWYAALPDRIVFATRAAALLAHPGVEAPVDPEAVGFYLTLGYVPAPRSIWRGVLKLPPAHCMTVTDAPAEPRRYWRLPETTEAIPPAQAVERVRQAVSAAVAERMAGGGSAGALISGGVDSSIVAALMAQAAGDAGGVKTFTAGFAESGFDERADAREVARHLGTDHREIVVSPAGTEGLLDRLVELYDEPLADSSALPTHLLCQAAGEHVEIALGGEGGDEVFGGYDRYRAMHLAGRMGPTRWALTKLAAWGAGWIAPHNERSRLRRLVRFASALDLAPARQYLAYRRLFSPGQLEALLERDFAAAAKVQQPGEWFTDLYEQGDYDDEPAHAQRHDLLTYMPDDLLVKGDTASTAAALRLRTPMIDHEVVSLGLSLPVGLKIRGRRGKAILRDAFAAMLPAAVLSRGKQGFAAPIGNWLRGELLEPLRRTLLDGPLVGRGWMSYLPLKRMIDDHRAGRADHRHRLWALLWLGRWLEKAP